MLQFLSGPPTKVTTLWIWQHVYNTLAFLCAQFEDFIFHTSQSIKEKKWTITKKKILMFK